MVCLSLTGVGFDDDPGWRVGDSEIEDLSGLDGCV